MKGLKPYLLPDFSLLSLALVPLGRAGEEGREGRLMVTHLECLAEVGGELDTDDGSPVVSDHHHRVERVEGHMGQLGALLLDD